MTLCCNLCVGVDWHNYPLTLEGLHLVLIWWWSLHIWCQQDFLTLFWWSVNEITTAWLVPWCELLQKIRGMGKTYFTRHSKKVMHSADVKASVGTAHWSIPKKNRLLLMTSQESSGIQVGKLKLQYFQWPRWHFDLPLLLTNELTTKFPLLNRPDLVL